MKMNDLTDRTKFQEYEKIELGYKDEGCRIMESHGNLHPTIRFIEGGILLLKHIADKEIDFVPYSEIRGMRLIEIKENA